MLGSLIANASSVKQKLDTLTNQASTGLIGDTYAGLGTGAPIALNLQPQMANLRTWQNNNAAVTAFNGVVPNATRRGRRTRRIRRERRGPTHYSTRR
jgi:hypothetical protein